MVKRAIDIVFSLLAMLLFLPFGLVFAVILKLTGEGEVFFMQPRVGKGGRLFDLLKLATMLKGSPTMGTGLLTIQDDPRVLPFGRFLRKTKLNEVPQLWNILKGDMSIIGPRPQAEAHFHLYTPEVQRELVKVRPGLSGIGSIAFRDEEKLLSGSGDSAADRYAKDIAAYKGSLEVWYVRHHSVWMDAVLAFLTIVAIVCPGCRLYQRVLKDLPRNSNPNLPL
jgi:lipopolysaccharide/colanic/teichoic acid biosynthesis glycosyltransferase